MPAPHPLQPQLDALARIRAAVAAHDSAGLAEKLRAERANLPADQPALQQLNNLLLLIANATAKFDREHARLDAIVNPPPPPPPPEPLVETPPEPANVGDVP